MQPISEAKRDVVRTEFKAYFERMNLPNKKQLERDADKLIANAGALGSAPQGVGAMDYSKPTVEGGGRRRISDGEAETIAKKYEKATAWGEVFDRVMDEAKSLEIKLIRMTWQEQSTNEAMAKVIFPHEDMESATRKLQRIRESIVLRAAILAAAKGLIEP